MKEARRSAQVRSRLSHPVVDADGHTIELVPILLDYIKKFGGSGMAERWLKYMDAHEMTKQWYRLTPEERRDRWVDHVPFFPLPTDTLDKATASLPRLMYERLDEFGIDFAIVYPSVVGEMITGPRGGCPDDELRRAVCRAANTYHADMFREYAGRMTPAAIIPMHTPQEAIDELEFAVKTLGLKAVMIAGDVRRPVPKLQREAPGLVQYGMRQDTFGIDSDYDYDPFWAKCIELKVAPTAHSGTLGWGTRRSISNSMYNHIGHFAASGEALCKSLFLGGVPKRFPTLNFAFLEGGVGWACSLLGDMAGHWEKRNGRAIHQLDPARIDQRYIGELAARYGDERVRAKLDDIRAFYAKPFLRPSDLDEFAACGANSVQDIRETFEDRFFFGCEGDDALTAQAFSSRTNPLGARFQPIFGSDIGHWDVPAMNQVVAEAHELVEHGAITENDFRDFVFTNPVRLHAQMNPDFFKGTVVQGAVEGMRPHPALS